MISATLALLIVAALLVGLSKTATAGASTIAVAIFAAVLPAREATATLLLLLIVGDVVALLSYRRHAEWRLLLKLAPMVIGGLVLGALFLNFADDVLVRRIIGIVLLALVLLRLWMGRRESQAELGRSHAIAYGLLGGFSTMVANAGGPVMSLYFLALKFDPLTFLGTSAWFFATVNLVKVPIVVGLGLLDWEAIQLVLLLVPAVLVGAFAGRWIAPRLSQRVFNGIVLALTAVGAAYLIVG